MASRMTLRRRISSLEKIQQQEPPQDSQQLQADAVAASSAVTADETMALIQQGAAAQEAAEPGAKDAAAASAPSAGRSRLLRRNSSTPCFSGSLSKVAHKLGRYVEECVYQAFRSEDAKGREHCVKYVTQVLYTEILMPVLIDLRPYKSDLNFEKFDFTKSRLILSNLENRVAIMRDRLLYPFHHQQVMDLSHLCGCIHAVRMRLGFLSRRVEPNGSVSVA